MGKEWSLVRMNPRQEGTFTIGLTSIQWLTCTTQPYSLWSSVNTAAWFTKVFWELQVNHLFLSLMVLLAVFLQNLISFRLGIVQPIVHWRVLCSCLMLFLHQAEMFWVETPQCLRGYPELTQVSEMKSRWSPQWCRHQGTLSTEDPQILSVV